MSKEFWTWELGQDDVNEIAEALAYWRVMRDSIDEPVNNLLVARFADAKDN